MPGGCGLSRHPAVPETPTRGPLPIPSVGSEWDYLVRDYHLVMFADRGHQARSGDYF